MWPDALCDIMNARTLLYTGAEVEVSGQLPALLEITCKGRFDLQFTDAKSKTVIMDMKWTQSTKWHRNLLDDNKDTRT